MFYVGLTECVLCCPVVFCECFCVFVFMALRVVAICIGCVQGPLLAVALSGQMHAVHVFNRLHVSCWSPFVLVVLHTVGRLYCPVMSCALCH